MQFYQQILFAATVLAGASVFEATEHPIPKEMQKIMDQPKYRHATWGMYVKDLNSGEVLYDLNGDKFFSPASTSKLFSVEALLNAYGDDYRFKTPVYAVGSLKDGVLQGDLVLVAQGDLTLGGRQSTSDTIAFTKLDHINANEVPGVILTPEDPLHGLNELAKQVAQKGIKEIRGDVRIDDSLFETVSKRGFTLSPIFLNENFIDFSINPGVEGQAAKLIWRPVVPGYEVVNELKTVAKGEPLAIEISSDEVGHKVTVRGTIPSDQKDLIRTFSIKDPAHFARAAFIQALEGQGIKVVAAPQAISKVDYRDLQPVALWTSPPLSEYGKLILKVSHNMGADLVPLLLAAQKGQKTFDDGMLLMGNFFTQTVKMSPEDFVFGDAAGGNDNRLTPKGEVQLLEYVHSQSPERFRRYFDALPILGVDGSLEDFAKGAPGAGKVRAKPGTGVSANLSTGKLFLTTQALGGYIEAKNGHLYAYMLVVNNASMPAIDDIFPIFEDVSELSNLIYVGSE